MKLIRPHDNIVYYKLYVPVSSASTVDGCNAIFSIITDRRYTQSRELLHFNPAGICFSVEVSLKKSCRTDVLCLWRYNCFTFVKKFEGNFNPFDFRQAFIFSGRKLIHPTTSPSSFFTFRSVLKKVNTWWNLLNFNVCTNNIYLCFWYIFHCLTQNALEVSCRTGGGIILHLVSADGFYNVWLKKIPDFFLQVSQTSPVQKLYNNE